jgi:RNA polymerase sigma-70 factor (ECF subfamily)
MVFNLHVIEGFKHDEIAHLLNISTGTSKSNLAIARSKLQKILLTERENQRRREQNG